MAEKSKKNEAVLVTTVHRGVFYGRLEPGQVPDSKTLVLLGCRNAIYWSGKKGFLGLAASGPEAGSTIGATAPRVRLYDVTSVTSVEDAAAKVWEDWV